MQIWQLSLLSDIDSSIVSLSFLSPTVNDIRRKHYMVGTYSTVEKRAKRIPDSTVETTDSIYMFDWKPLAHLFKLLMSACFMVPQKFI